MKFCSFLVGLYQQFLTIQKKRELFLDFLFFKKALKRGVLVTVEANFLQIDSKVSLSFDTGKVELSWGGRNE